MNVLNMYSPHFYKTRAFVYGTSDYALDSHSSC